MRNKTTKKLLIIAIILLIFIALGVGFLLIPFNSNEDTSTIEEVIPKEIVVEEDSSLFTKTQYDDYYAINSDYIGQIIFNSKIINEPVVYSSVNSYYLRKNLNKEYSIQGTIYLDERNTLNDENIIIYGHYTEPGYTDYPEYQEGVRPMFSNLELLLDESNYEANKDVYLYLKDEVRHYVVTNVYYCPLVKDDNGDYVYVEDGYNYYYTSYTESELEAYKQVLKDKSLYATGQDITINDKLLTLQTCVNAREDLREIVVLKLVDSKNYD